MGLDLVEHSHLLERQEVDEEEQGPQTEPWGTPVVRVASDDGVLLIWTTTLRPVR